MPAPTTRELVREDFATFSRSKAHPGWHALALHRFGGAVHRAPRGRRRLGKLAYRLGRLIVGGLYHIEIPVQTRIGRRLYLPHPHGVVLHARCVIGDDCMIRHNVTIGAGSDTRGGFPTVGDRVQFGPGAVVMGDVVIGDDVLVGPNAVVVHDVPAGSRVLAPTADARPPKQRPAQVPRRDGTG